MASRWRCRDVIDERSPRPHKYLTNHNAGTALFVACAENQVELADKLLTLGAVVDFENQRGHTALSGRVCVVPIR